MGEFRRIIGTRKYFLLAILLIAANLVIFQYSERHTLEIMSDDASRNEYIDNYMSVHSQEVEEYKERIESMEDTAEELLGIGIFENSSFSSKNIQKTLDDYAGVRDVSIKSVFDKSIESVLGYKVVHLIVLIHTLILVGMFFDERKNGLWNIVHTCKNGRAYLAACRFFIMFTATAVFTVLTYITLFLLALYDYRGFDIIAEAAQSVVILQDFVLPVSVGGFAVYYIIMQTFSALCTALLIWLIFSVIHNRTYAAVVTALLFLLGYYIGIFINVQNPLCILRYTNLYFLVNTTEVYTSYINFGAGPFIFNNREFTEIMCIILSIVLPVMCIIANVCVKPVYQAGFIERSFVKLNECAHKAVRVFHGFGFELYKFLVIYRGILVLALFVYIAWQGMGLKDITRSVYYTELKEFYKEYSGEIDEERLAVYETMVADVMEAEKKYLAAQTEYTEGRMNVLDYEDALNEYKSYEIERRITDTLKQKVDLADEMAEKGIKLWFADTDGVNHLLGDISRTKRIINDLMALFVIILLVVLYQAGEKKSGMKMLIRSCVRGRGNHYKNAALAILGLSVIVCVVIYGMECYDVWYSYGLGCMSAPVQNLDRCIDFPLKISIGTYVAVWYALRFLLVIGAGACVYIFFEKKCTLNIFRRKERSGHNA